MENLEQNNFYFDVAIPNNNEQQFIDVALSLNHSRILFLTDDVNYPKKFSDLKNKLLNINKIDIKLGFYVRNVNDINRLKGFDYTFADAERKFFEAKIDYILDAELSERNDSFHYKSTRLNQVHAELSVKNNQTIVFGFSNLINSKNLEETFGRMNQNASLVKKYHISFAVFSIADTPSKLRSKTILESLNNVLFQN